MERRHQDEPTSRRRRGRVIDHMRRYRRVPRARTDAALAAIPDDAHRLRRSLRLAMLVFIQYALLASDIRFVSSANYLGIAAVNVCIAINTWYLTRGIVDAKTRFDRFCFVAGGTAGALIAVLVT